MSRLIDADELIVMEYGGIKFVPKEFIDDAPTVDAVPVIRCKDCKHFHYDMPYLIQGIPVLMREICTFWGDGCKTSENEFCSHAERRQDETH